MNILFPYSSILGLTTFMANLSSHFHAGGEIQHEPMKAPIQVEMVLVSGGTFEMGCNLSPLQECAFDEKPTHQVSITPFLLGKYEVTQEQWTDVMGSNPSHFSDCATCPVENVSWEEVQAFISRLNAQTGSSYRLPTEAEWEFASRNGSGSGSNLFSGSSQADAVAWFLDNGEGIPHPVGQKAANGLGIHDMTGNVSEWCSDWFGKYEATAQYNPSGPQDGKYKVVRGGSVFSKQEYCRVTDRMSLLPTQRNEGTGFRLALNP
jgi:formylglycine-generating enzyme required for sulfatase activity